MLKMKKTSILFGALLRTIEAELRTKGFSRKNQVFYIKKDGNWALIEFQKSQKSDSQKVIFTVNLGIASGRLQEFFTGRSENFPFVDRCQWRQRIGFLTQNQEDKWWIVDSEASVESTSAEVLQLILDIAIPEIERLTTDEELRNLWISQRSPGLTQIQRLMNLSVLLQQLGPAEHLPQILDQLQKISQGKPTEGLVRNHMKKLSEKGIHES